MRLWHLTPDAPRRPLRVTPGAPIALEIGTWPIEPGQSVWVVWRRRRGGVEEHGRQMARWERNSGGNSYWRAQIGPFEDGDEIGYTIEGRSPAGVVVRTAEFSFRVGPSLHVAILWHHHQPLYRDAGGGRGARRLRLPWVRLHALRDYYSMAALAAAHDVRVTINFTPVLLEQIDDYVERGATDCLLSLTTRPAERLGSLAVEALLSMAFDADWHRQIQRHPRYRELFEQRAAGKPFTTQDLRDVQMWSTLAWFGHEFRTGVVRLATGEEASVQRLVEQGRGYTRADLDDMLAEQQKILRAIVPLHRQLQAEGRIEVSISPAYHPILPLLIDTDTAYIDRPGAGRPPRFAHPEDAAAQVARAIADYRARFGKAPDGMWPSEGAVSPPVLRLLGEHGIRWTATDRGVLARSGRWGYDVSKPDVLYQPYQSAGDAKAPVVFFRDTVVSDAIGFRGHMFADAHEAVEDIMRTVIARMDCLEGAGDRVLTVALDGENAWGAYPEDGRPFLHAFYARLAADPRLRTVTFGEYLSGNPARGVLAHTKEELPRVYELATGSWSDEPGSAPGVDLGTWIGEPEENAAWALLAQAHDAIDSAASRVGPERLAIANTALYAAEGSDWFWWFGSDQDARHDATFDRLFRRHLRVACRAAGVKPPPGVRRPLVPRTVVWTFARPIRRITSRDRMTLRTNCPGRVSYRVDGGETHSVTLVPVGGVLAGARRFQATIGPFADPIRKVTFWFTCDEPSCARVSPLCRGVEQTVDIA